MEDEHEYRRHIYISIRHFVTCCMGCSSGDVVRKKRNVSPQAILAMLQIELGSQADVTLLRIYIDDMRELMRYGKHHDSRIRRWDP